MRSWMTCSAILLVIICGRVRAENQNTISLTIPTLTPGEDGTFSATQSTGASASGSGRVYRTYSGLRKFILSSGSGRYANHNGIDRLGVAFDTFQIFQSFISKNFFTSVSSGTTCPAATDYTFMTTRFRAWNALDWQDASQTNTYFGGTISYDPAGSPLFDGINFFNLAGPTLYNTAWDTDGHSAATCSGGKLKLDNSASDPMDDNGTIYWGDDDTYVYISSHGSPLVQVGIKQHSLTSGLMDDLDGYVLSGLFTKFANKGAHTVRNVLFYPDSNGTTYTIKEVSDLEDPFTSSTIGTLVCTSLDSPTTGFCSGSLTLVGVTGTGNAVCQASIASGEDKLLTCVAQQPDRNEVPLSFVVTAPKTSTIAVTLPNSVAATSPAHSPTINATVKNLTGRPTTIGDPASGALQLQAPFSNTGAFSGGGGGACSGTLNGFESCTVTITYDPSSYGTNIQTYRVAYDDGTTTVNATAKLVGTTGLTSIAITPSTASFSSGDSQQFTATATYADASTEDVSQACNWSVDNGDKATIDENGYANFYNAGDVVITASLFDGTSTVSDTQSTTVTSYLTSNLRGSWNALYADGKAPYLIPNNSWKDISGNSRHATNSDYDHAAWTGTGTYSSPYCLAYDGQGYTDFGSSPLSSQTKMMFTGWVKSANVSSSSDAVVLGNSSNATGNGFTVRQHPSYRDAVMSLNPVGYWRLGESSGTTATDLGSGGNNGTYTNGPTLAQAGGLDSDLDTAASFDGSDDYVEIGDANSLTPGTALTLSAWINITSLPGGGSFAEIFNKWNQNNEDEYLLSVDNAGQLNFGFHTTGSNSWGTTAYNNVVGTKVLSTGTWYFVAVVRDNASIKFYVDGVLDSSSNSADSNPFRNGTKALRLGMESNSRYFNGSIDEPALFFSALTDAQIASLYQAGTTGKTMDFVIGKSYQDVIMADSPVGYWRLGETSGTTARDSSGSGKNGEYLNTPTLGANGALSGDADTAVTFSQGSAESVGLDSSSYSFDRNQPFSISAWFKTTNNGHNTVFAKMDSGTAYRGYAFILSISTLSFYFINNYFTSDTIGADGPSGLNDGNWHHGVVTYDGSGNNSGLNMYIDGTNATSGRYGTITGTATNSVRPYIARRQDGYSFDGSLDEVAAFDYELSSTQVLRQYQTGSATHGGICRSTTSFSDALWNSIAGIFSGSTAKFFVNGREECSVSVSNGFTSPATNLIGGATAAHTKSWTGSLSDLKVYGTSNGSAVGTATDVKTDFDKNADTYRQNPVGNIVLDHLVLNLDAANAQRGLRPFANGCGVNDLGWFDLSSSAFIGTLTNFGTCGTYGWKGSGVYSSPYRLTFDGTDDYVSIPNNSALNPSAGVTAETWIKPAANNADYQLLIKWSDNANDDGNQYHLWINGGVPKMHIGQSNQTILNAAGSTVTANEWLHIVGVADTNDNQVKLYQNGALIGSSSYDGTLSAGGATPSQVGIGVKLLSGSVANGHSYFSGSIAKSAIYDRSLTSSEVYQNFAAQADRFRETPVAGIVTNGLVLNLDAANAGKGGLGFPGTGCAITDWLDISKSLLTGTLTNFDTCATYGWKGDGSSGDPYRAVFDGSDDYVEIPDNAALDLTTAFSIELWMKTNVDGKLIVNHYNPGNYHGYGLGMGIWGGANAGKLGVWSNNQGSWVHGGINTMNDNTWHHVVVVHESTQIKFYTDNLLTFTGAYASPSVSTNSLYIGAGGILEGGYYFQGQLPKVAIYDRALSPSEISQNCNALKSRFSGATCQ